MEFHIPILPCMIILTSVVRAQEFFNTTPQPINSNFTCAGRITGYYADVPSNCRAYHNCDDQGNKFSYYCPEMTAFRQDALICDHAHLVDCEAGTRIGKRIIHSNDLRKTTATPLRKDVGTSTSGPFQVNTSWTTASTFLRNNRFPGAQDPGRTVSSFGSYQTNSKASERIEIRKDLVNSRDQSTRWHNFERNEDADFQGRTEAEAERRTATTATRILFGQTSTTKSYFQFRSSNRTQSENSRLKSTQSETTPIVSSTTDISVHDVTASLKPLVPNTLEYDPYYPREPHTSTEVYYTPAGRRNEELPEAVKSLNFEHSLVDVHFKIPDVWPDLNTLEDIVDRRRLFYIPRTKKIG